MYIISVSLFLCHKLDAINFQLIIKFADCNNLYSVVRFHIDELIFYYRNTLEASPSDCITVDSVKNLCILNYSSNISTFGNYMQTSKLASCVRV